MCGGWILVRVWVLGVHGDGRLGIWETGWLNHEVSLWSKAEVVAALGASNLPSRAASTSAVALSAAIKAVSFKLISSSLSSCWANRSSSLSSCWANRSSTFVNRSSMRAKPASTLSSRRLLSKWGWGGLV